MTYGMTILLPALGGRCRIRYPHSGMRGAVTLPFRCLFCRNPLGLTRGACTAQPGAPASSEPPPHMAGGFLAHGDAHRPPVVSCAPCNLRVWTRRSVASSLANLGGGGTPKVRSSAVMGSAISMATAHR